MASLTVDGGDFEEKMTLLRERVGGGKIEAQIYVDQVYAHYQDSGEGPHGKPAEAFDHPRGGEAGYLSRQTTERGPEVAQRWADSALEGNLVGATIESVNSIMEQAFMDAPREFWILRNSVGGSVSDNGRAEYDKPPNMPRLDQAELDAIRAAAGEDYEGQHQSGAYGGALSHDLRIMKP